jgi:hypothetical protein
LALSLQIKLNWSSAAEPHPPTSAHDGQGRRPWVRRENQRPSSRDSVTGLLRGLEATLGPNELEQPGQLVL